MPLSFLQDLLPNYSFSPATKKSFPLFIKNKEDPIFCVLPRAISSRTLKKALSMQEKHPSILWICHKPFLNLFFCKRPFPQILQPLYFLEKSKKGFFLWDRRYLQLEKKIYKLPVLKVNLTEISLKSEDLKELERFFLFPERTSPFYCQGDSTERLLHPAYLNSLIARKNFKKKKEKISHKIYFFLKKLVDS